MGMTAVWTAPEVSGMHQFFLEKWWLTLNRICDGNCWFRKLSFVDLSIEFLRKTSWPELSLIIIFLKYLLYVTLECDWRELSQKVSFSNIYYKWLQSVIEENWARRCQKNLVAKVHAVSCGSDWLPTLGFFGSVVAQASCIGALGVRLEDNLNIGCKVKLSEIMVLSEKLYICWLNWFGCINSFNPFFSAK